MPDGPTAGAAAPPPKKSGWDRATILVPWMLTLATALIGIVQFGETQKMQNRTLEAANSRPFLEKQLAVVFQASDDAAILATTTDAAEWRKARRDFARLHYGQLRVTEDRELEAAMSEFMEVLPPEDEKPLELPMHHLELRALKIAAASRAVIAKSWRVDLGRLEDEAAGKP